MFRIFSFFISSGELHTHVHHQPPQPQGTDGRPSRNDLCSTCLCDPPKQNVFCKHEHIFDVSIMATKNLNKIDFIGNHFKKEVNELNDLVQIARIANNLL